MICRKIKAFAIAAIVVLAPISHAADDKKSVSKDYTVGRPTQSVKPREMKETVRPDGKTSVVTGQQRDSSGKITGPHSHSVTNQGKVEYSRTQAGRVVGGGGGIPSGDIRGGGGGGINSGGGGSMRPDKK